VEHYLVPMGAAIWSAPPATFLGIPARFLLGFFHNHGLLQIRDRPQWRTIVGGSRTYVDALARPLGRRMRLATPIRSVRRHDDRVTIALDCGETESFDKVVLATHADATRAMLDDPSDEERSLLSAFDYQRNEAVLHTDQAWLPARRRAWASWNYHLRSHGDEAASVTYDLNRLQRLGGRNPLLLTLNPSARIAPANTLRSFVYRHPVFGKRSVAAQRVAHRISGVRRTYYCGAYWGHGFHEDGVNSALAACRQFGIGLEACTVACTKGASGITVAAQ